MSDYLWVGTRRRANTNLLALAVLDAALIAYPFDEASGTIINYVTPGTYDMASVSANVLRQQTGISGPDLKAIKGSIVNGAGGGNFGHAQGAVGPLLNGNQTLTMEIVVKTPLTKTGTIFGIDNAATGAASMAFVALASDNSVHADISVTGQAYNSSQISNDATIASAFKHFVITWDGARRKAYYQGALVLNSAIGGGATGIFQGGTPKIYVCGDFDDNTGNIAATLDFAAVYTTVALTQAQVTAHFLASGC